MIATITLEAKDESEFVEKLNEIENSITTNTIEDCEMMDGSYKIGTTTIELELV